MQCPNCQFQNMPGSEQCGRCGGSLRLATAVMDVHPPRASQLRKRVRRTVPVRRVAIRARQAMEDAGATERVRRLRVLAPWPLLLRMALPGWVHFYMGQPIRGHLFLWGTLVFLLPGLLMLGTVWGSIWMGMAFSVHSWDALDAVTQTFPDAGQRDRMARSVLVSILLGLFVYVPAGLLLFRVADPTVITLDMPPLARGDVLLVNHLAEPRPGYIVVYEEPTFTIAERNGHERRFTHITGERIDRILAGPGDRVVWDKGKLTVNGQPSDLQPLNPSITPRHRLEVLVPAECVFILPSTTPYLRAEEDDATWRGLGTVGRERISGRVFARTNPLSRFSRFH
jgi:signal peptidase I